jgi:hypothetical protein
MIERLYPGVFLAEVEFNARPIDGVPTETAPPAPAWTESQTHDPGVTLLELLAYSAEPLMHRADLAARGTAQGLALEPSGPGTGVRVSPGIALDAGGRTLSVDLAALTSKYIGETEKNLSRAFGDATPSHALLRHEDSDALFGKDD